MGLSDICNNYRRAHARFEPFEVTDAVEQISNHMMLSQRPKHYVPSVIHWYVSQGIEYEGIKRPDRPYKTAEQTILSRQGCCAEKSAVAIALARCVGIESKFVFIKNKKWEDAHAGAYLYVPEMVFVDGTMSFGSEPEGEEIVEMDDQEAKEMLLRWNQEPWKRTAMRARDCGLALFSSVMLVCGVYSAYQDITRPHKLTSASCVPEFK